jgi:transposase
MRKAVKLRTLTTEEETEIRKIAASRKATRRLVQRAKVIAAMLDDPKLHATHAGLQAGYRGCQSGVDWVKRFNAEGMAGLEDKPKAGRPATHAQSVRSALVKLARTKPESLGYPYKLWTLERLQSAFQEREGVHLSDSTIWEWVEAEGFRWKRQESWFHNAEKADPEFVEKRGVSSQPIKPPPQARE